MEAEIQHGMEKPHFCLLGLSLGPGKDWEPCGKRGVSQYGLLWGLPPLTGEYHFSQHILLEDIWPSLAPLGSEQGDNL